MAREEAEWAEAEAKIWVEALKATDPMARKVLPADHVSLVRMRKEAAFNDPGEEVAAYPADRKPAAQRLAKILSANSPEWEYFAKVPVRTTGRYDYHVARRFTAYLTPRGRAAKRRRMIGGRKSALSRALNRARAIRREHAAGLFPSGYREDPRYLVLAKAIRRGVARVRRARRMDPDEVEAVEGGIDPKTARSAVIFLCRFEDRTSAEELVKNMVREIP